MKRCFISMPLGLRNLRSTGEQVDFNNVFAKLIEPATAEADLEPLRWETVISAGGAFTQRDAIGAIISCDVLLADVSTSNPNVLYELGVRHMANRGPTVIIAAEGEPLPFYISYIPAFFYKPHSPEDARPRLANALRSAALRSDGSPIYEFFPSLNVDVPNELRSERRRKAAVSRRSWSRGAVNFGPQSAEKLERAESEARADSEGEPAAFIEMLKACRDAGDWDRLIRAGQSPPPALAQDPRVAQLVALALSQRGGEGDDSEALGIMQKLLDQSHGDAEVYGIMGRIFKNRYKRSYRQEDLRLAIEHYRKGFDLQPNDLYAGYNAVTLTSMLPPDDPMRAGQDELLSQVKGVLLQRLDSGEVSYSLLTAAIELAVVERSWDEARNFAERANALARSDWERLASIESLRRLGDGLEPSERQALDEIIARLHKEDSNPDEEDEFDA